MKIVLSSLLFLLISANASAIDWKKAASDLMADKEGGGSASATGAVDYAKGLLPALSDVTGADLSQSEAGAGSILALVKENLSSDDFTTLKGMVPDLNLESLVKAAPAVASSSSSLTSLLGGSEGSVVAVKKVYDQFKSLGLSTEQLGQYVEVMQGFLQSEGGQSAVKLFKKGIGSLAG